MGTQLPHLLKGHSPQFSANVRCGQIAGWTKMPLSMEVGLSPGDVVLDGDPTLPQTKGTAAPSFRPMSIVATAARLRYYWAPAELLYATTVCMF